MRAKFRCNSVKYTGDPDNANTPRTYELTAVYDTRTDENRRFAKATPIGTLTMQIDNPDAALQVGEEYYLDFTACTTADATPESMGNTHAWAEGDRLPAVAVTGDQLDYTPAHGTPEAERAHDRQVSHEEDVRAGAQLDGRN